jgi:hypothetical protein
MLRDLPDDELDDSVWLDLADRIGRLDEGSFDRLAAPVRAFYATRVFEWQVGNGGLYQFFLNYDHLPWFITAVLDGYTALGLEDQRQVLEREVLPVAGTSDEQQLRDSERRSPSLGWRSVPPGERSRLNALDHRIGEHTAIRLAMVRSRADLFVG